MKAREFTHFSVVAVGRTKSGRTVLFDVVPKDGGPKLGSVHWYAPWRRYVFQPCMGTIYEPVCLRGLADVCETLTKEHKA